MRQCQDCSGRACVWLGAVVVFAIAACYARAVEPQSLEEFRQCVRQWTTGSGCLLFSSQPPEDSKFAGRSTFGFDPATGAWFFTDQSRVAGRTPDGVAYRGNADSVDRDPDQGLRLPGPLASQIPMTVALTLLQTTEGLVDLSKDTDGNWAIEYIEFALEGQAAPHARVVFDANGRPLRFERDAWAPAGQEAVAYEYEFVSASKEPLLIAIPRLPKGAVSPPREFVDIQYYPGSRPELFTTEAVLAIAVDNRMRSQMKLNALAAQIPGSDSSRGDAAPSRYVETPLDRARWPLMISGIIVVAIGVIALFRARAAR